jgi:translocator protein
MGSQQLNGARGYFRIMFTKYPVARLIAALAICLSAGYADLYFFVSSVSVWFVGLQKPSFVPSISIIYYGIIAISVLLAFTLYSLWNAAQKNREARLAVWLFIIGLLLNMAWFLVFFWARSVFFSMAVIVLLLTVVLATIYQSLRSAVLAVLFQIPYLLILIAATYVTAMIYLMNPGISLLGVAL